MAGIIEDYSDIINKYHNKDLSFDEYCKQFYQREQELTNKENNKKSKQLDYINKQIITNN